MNQICKNIITRLNAVKLVSNLRLSSNNSQPSYILASQTCFRPIRLNLNSFLCQRYYSTLPESEGDGERTYRKPFRGSFEKPGSRFSGSQRPTFGGGFKDQRPPGGQRATKTSTIEDFEGSEPVETSGKESDYHSKDNSGFSGFNLPTKLLAQLEKLGYKAPFQIQEETLPHTLSGKDVVGKAFTGSGKTLAFALPIIARIMNNPAPSRFPKCLVLSPTRELCLQLTKSISELAPSLKCVAVYGGADSYSQINALKGKVDVVCATPGRLRDMMERNYFVTSHIELICLDEADELLRPNFLDQIKDVIEISNTKQMLMFSATINKEVRNLVQRYMKNPVLVDLTEGKKCKLPANIDHHICVGKVYKNQYAQLIQHYMKHFNSDRCIVFTNRKVDAAMVDDDLRRDGIKSTEFHSGVTQARRENLLDKFRKGRINCLVATDVAARGIDIPEVNLIIHLSTPMNLDSYIHRSGRAGRAGRPGHSVLIDGGHDRDSNIAAFGEISRVIKFRKLEKPIVSDDRQPLKQHRNENDDDDNGDAGGYNNKPKRYSSSYSNSGSTRFGSYKKPNYFRKDEQISFSERDGDEAEELFSRKPMKAERF